MRHVFEAIILLLVLGSLFSSGAAATVLTFEDLDYYYTISGTNYAGLTWEMGNQGYEGNQGFWVTTNGGLSWPYSGVHNITNGWGCTLIGIGFPAVVSVQGAYIAAQSASSVWTTGVRVHGYLGGSEVNVTSWFTDIDNHPDWFAMNLSDVDRIVIESQAVSDNAGWYGLDNLTFDAVPEPSSLLALVCGLFGITGVVCRRKR